MIKLDISNVWGSVEFGDLMAIEKDVSAAHACLTGSDPEVLTHLGWQEGPATETEE